MKPRVTGVILAGGRSRRMGTDKRRVLIDGVPLILRVVARVGAVSDEVLVVTRIDDASLVGLLRGTCARLVHDRRADAGPLAGMEAAALEASSQVLVVVAGDMPWLASPLLAELTRRLGARADTDAVAVITDRGRQPMLASYRRGALEVAAAELLDAGERRATRLLGRLRVETLAPDVWRCHDPGGRSVENINEPADLERSA